MTGEGRPGRTRGSRLRDLPLVVWLVCAVVVALVHRWVPEAVWLLVHLVALGAMTHAVLVWSAHFTAALLKSRPDARAAAAQTRRLMLLSVGALLVLVGVPWAHWWLVVLGGTLVAVAVTWHAAFLAGQLRQALPGRFRVTVRYYVAAALCLPVGVGFGVALAAGLDDHWHANLLVAHTMANLLGFIGLTVVGTLVTFWPTVLRTRMDPRSESLAAQALPVLVAGVVVTVAGALVWRPAAVVGVVGYALGLMWWGRSLVRPARTKPPREFAAASIGAACLWALVALVATAWQVLRADDLALAGGYPTLASIWVVGFLLQLVTGALSYLVPSVIGGGPRVVRAGGRWFDRAATLRLTIINAGLVLWLLPLPGWVRVGVSSLVLVALAAFLPLMIGAVRACVTERRTPAEQRPEEPERRPALTATGLLAGVTALSVVVAAGVAMDPGALGAGRGPTEEVAASGRIVQVDVTAHDMRFTPSSISANPGDRVVIRLTNTDPVNVHDLAVGDRRTPRLATGETAELDLGVVAASTQGWCTIVGHRQMGMTFDVVVAGATAAAEATVAPSHSGPPSNPDAELGSTINPVLPRLPKGTVHKVTLTVTEVPLEVAPGIWQKRWTFNGGGVGPTLHGRVGDVFEVTLVNDGSMGHSIDFHAGALAPDKPMRTIAPGQRLVYRFTAVSSGIWMYHCSTAPMSSHISAGMHGAVVIEPEEGLPAVDREYILVQSEVHLDGAGGSAEESREVNADKVAAGQPDKVVFNGIANQYDQRPFQARVGERVRFWVLDAGPNRASAFHIVGGQFDTVYLEGAYRLRNGRGPMGETGGGSQALGLQPAQGGFVELAFPEAGHYPVVSHIMSDAERGAHGIVEVTD